MDWSNIFDCLLMPVCIMVSIGVGSLFLAGCGFIIGKMFD